LKYAFVDDTAKSLLVIFWWSAYLLGNIVYGAVIYWQWQAYYWRQTLGFTLEAFNDYLFANWLGLSGDLLRIVAAIAAIVVIVKISRRQDEKYRRLSNAFPYVTPPPVSPAPVQT
jgi:hypothetical protein